MRLAQSLRSNRADEHAAACSGLLLDLLYARAGHCYTKVTLTELATYGFEPDEERTTCMAPKEVCALRAMNFCGGDLRHCQPMDLRQEEGQAEIHALGPTTTRSGAIGVTAMFNNWLPMREALLKALAIKVNERRPRAHKDTMPDFVGAHDPERPPPLQGDGGTRRREAPCRHRRSALTT